MVQRKTKIVAADNSGVQLMSIIHIYGASKQNFARLGDVVQCVVRKADPQGMVKDDELVKVVIVRTHKEYHRADGSYIRFDDNAVVLLNNAGEMRGTRIFGPVARELRDQNMKIISLAPEVL